MRFEKWQALGNDYLIVEADELPFELTAARVRKLCAAHLGVFADGVLLLSPPADPADVADLRIFNPDGSEAELSGNGAREAILYLRRRGWTAREEFSIGTPAGRLRPRITGSDTCTVDMGHARLSSPDYPGGAADGRGELEVDGRAARFQHVSIGNPQCSIRLASEEELDALDLPAIGPGIEADARFPNRTNVSWYVPVAAGAPAVGPDRGGGDGDGDGVLTIRARIFERGVGETMSSGTGASGAAVAFARELEDPAWPLRVNVMLDGGELLVEVAADLGVNLTGWARPVFAGTLSEDFEKELHETE
jgi:diaminopimelate epimerase